MTGSRIGRRRRGYTLVEAIAAMSIVAVLGTASSSIIYVGVSGYLDASVRAEMHVEESAAFDRLTRALWSMGRDTTASVVAPNLSSVTPTSLAWDTNWTLSLSGTNLQLVENGGAAGTLLTDVSAFSVQTYDESNTALAASLSGAATQPVRRIQLQVTLTRQGRSETLRTRVFIRSTMSGAAIG